MNVTVEWEPSKGQRNRRKHGVSFEEAQELFLSGGEYPEFFDSLHSEEEDRFLAIGPTAQGILVVVWTEREPDAIRIISARLATERKQGLYHSCMERHR
jgi:uncharacterized protein